MSNCKCPNGSYGKKHTDACNEAVRSEAEQLRALAKEQHSTLVAISSVHHANPAVKMLVDAAISKYNEVMHE